MKTSRILVKGEWDENNRVSFKMTKTVFYGEGTLDYKDTQIANEKTEYAFTEAEFEEYEKNTASLNTFVAKYFIKNYNLDPDAIIIISID
jgi:hypothetical protein